MKKQTERHWFRATLQAPSALRQVGAILATSCVLGLAFNASNPIGIRWTEPNEAPAVVSPGPNLVTPLTQPHPEPQTDQRGSPVVDSAVTEATEVERRPLSAEPEPQPASYVPPSPTTWVEVEPLHEAGNVVLVDARTRAEFDAGHIPDAISLPEPPATEDLQAFLGQYRTNAHVVTYCGSTSCSLSFKLAHRLAKEKDYTFVQYMTGGYQAYQRAVNLAKAGGENPTGPVATSSVSSAGAADLGRPDSTASNPVLPSDRPLDNALPINWVQTKPLLEIGRIVLLDARPKAQFDAGHIPGARSLTFDAEVEEIERTLKSREAGKRMVTYCGRMGCMEAFRLANRLLHEFKVRNVWFMVEGYEDWRESEQNTEPRRSNSDS